MAERWKSSTRTMAEQWLNLYMYTILQYLLYTITWLVIFRTVTVATMHVQLNSECSLICILVDIKLMTSYAPHPPTHTIIIQKKHNKHILHMHSHVQLHMHTYHNSDMLWKISSPDGVCPGCCGFREALWSSTLPHTHYTWCSSGWRTQPCFMRTGTRITQCMTV